MPNINKIYTIDPEGWDGLLGGGLISDDILCLMGEKRFPRDAFLLRLLAKLVVNNDFPQGSVLILCGPEELSACLQDELRAMGEAHKNNQPAVLFCQELTELFALLQQKTKEKKCVVAVFLIDLADALQSMENLPANEILQGLYEQSDLLVYSDTFDREVGPKGPYRHRDQCRSVGDTALVALKAFVMVTEKGQQRACLVNIDTDERLSFAMDTVLT